MICHMGQTRDGFTTTLWERSMKVIFCDLCIREVDIGNGSTKHLNKEGWTNLINGFNERNSKEYTKIQLKNK